MNKCARRDFTISDINGEKVKIGERTFVFTAHKPREAEQLIYQLKFITPLTKLVTLASENQLARGLCFVSHSKLIPRPKESQDEKDSATPPRFILPLGFDAFDQNAISKKAEATSEIARDAQRTFESFFELMTEAFQTSLFHTIKDQVSRAMRSGGRRIALPDLMEKWGEQLTKTTTKEMQKRESEFERFTQITDAQRLTPDQIYRTMAINRGLKDLLAEYDRYEGVYCHLKESANYQKLQDLYEVLRVISQEEISYGSILNSACLNPECSYSAIHYGTIPALEKCPICNHEVLTFLSCNLDDQVSSAWDLTILQEMILAYILVGQSWVKRVWLHKAILERKEEKFTESVWVDLILQTKEDKLLFVDVTTQNDLANVINDLQKKWELFSKSGVEFDGFICVSCSVPLPKYINPVGKAWLLGASHLDKVYSHMEYIYEHEIKQNRI